MADTKKLLKVHAHLTAAIRSAEPWEASYKTAPAAFKRLVQEEANLQSNANEYLIGLSDRVHSLVNWTDDKLMTLRAAAVDPLNSDAWKEEARLLMALVLANIVELQTIGANAGEEAYNIPLGISTLDEHVIAAADSQTAQLVSQITATTRRYIQISIKKSIELGENVDAMIKRIRNVIASPIRAEMIAQTEAVTAYQTGLEHFAIESGAESSTWDSLLGACTLCAPLNGITKPIGEDFQLGNGTFVSRPPGHVRCRCGRILNYPK